MIPDDLLKQWVETRTLSNALYSLYKDQREREESVHSIIMERLRDQGLSEDEVTKRLTKMRKVIDEK